MKTEVVCKCGEIHEGRYESERNVPADASTWKTQAEVRRSILRRLTRRLAEEGLIESSNDKQSIFEQRLLVPEVLVGRCN